MNHIRNLLKRPHLFAIGCLSFSSGFPFLLIVSTLPIWLKDVNCNLEQISYIFLISLPYSLKFLWAPIIDQYHIPILGKQLGHRRAWTFASQVFLFLFIILLAHSNPGKSIFINAILAFIVSFCAATQDIAIDAYRIERLSKEELGIGTSISGIGFRLGMLASGAGTVYLSSFYSWKIVYIVSAFVNLIGLLMVLLVKEPSHNREEASVQSMYQVNETGFWAYLVTVYKSFINVTRHANWQYILLFILLFKISDTAPNSMSSIFFMDCGFTKVQLGDAKAVGIAMMILGTFVGGLVVVQYDILKSILICGMVQLISPLALYLMSFCEPQGWLLLCVQGIQCFVCGVGSAAFVTYLSSLCSGGFTATQFSVLSSFSSISRIILSSLSGWTIAWFDLSWSSFFLYATLVSCLFLFPIFMLSEGRFKLKALPIRA